MVNCLKLSALSTVLLLSAGCHHIHMGYAIPLYMQPKGFSQTYKDHLFSTPVSSNYSTCEYHENQSTCQKESCEVPSVSDSNGEKEQLKLLFEGNSLPDNNHHPENKQETFLPALRPSTSTRIGQREMVPTTSTRRSQRF